MLNDKRLEAIEATRKGTNKVDKAQAYDADVSELLAEIKRLRNDNRLLQVDKDRFKTLERLELAVQSVGYSRGPMG